MTSDVDQQRGETGSGQLALSPTLSPLRAASKLQARFAYLRGQYPPVSEWPNKRCWFVARTGMLDYADYKRLSTESDNVSAVNAMKNPAVQAYLANRDTDDMQQLGYGAADVLDDLWLGTEMALGRMPQQRAVILTDKDGEVRVKQVQVMDTDVGKAHRYLETWAKHHGLIVERIEAGGPGDFASLSDAELLAELRAAGLAPEQLPEPRPEDDEDA